MAGEGESELPHRPVLYQEIIHFLQPRSGGFYVDCTVGAGGHAGGILQASAPQGRLLGLELDPQALTLARQRLAAFFPRLTLVQASYVSLSQQLEALGWEQVDGVLLDLGASSMQFDTAERGFSFLRDGPLDMRFDPQGPLRAEDLVNGLEQEELADLIYRYGEERQSRRIARAIVAARPLHTTTELAEVVSKAVKGPPGDIHPATRVFQALRIAVNNELQALQGVLPQAVAALAEGGRLAVIAFHSLEDRIVKEYLRRESRDCICPPEQPVCTCDHRASVKVVSKRPIRPGAAEVEANPRARSARLRVAERL